MRGKTAAVAIAGLVLACGGDEDCAKREGMYLVTTTVRSGDCPPLEEQLVSMDGAAPNDPNCSGFTTESEDHCKVTIDRKCSEVSGGYLSTSHMKGVVTWSTYGRSGTGILTVQFSRDNVPFCSGSYGVKYLKQ